MKNYNTICALIVLYSLFDPLFAQAGKSNPNGPTKIPKTDDKVASFGSNEMVEDEISLVIKGKIISVTDKEIVYKETGANAEGRAPIHNLHFIRKTNGEYRFFAPAQTELKNPTRIATEEVKPKESQIPDSPAKAQVFLTAGGVLHLAKNSDSADYINGLSTFVANAANQVNNPKGFTGRLVTDAPKMQYQGFVEPRIVYKQAMIGLSAGYATFQKIAGTVSSPNYSNALTLSLEGYFVPIFAIFYFRLPLTANLSVNLGIGGGVMHTSIRYMEDDTFTNNSARYTAWSAVALAKPEFSYRMGSAVLMLSTPFYFAESRKVESGSISLVNGGTGKVISPNLTGVSFSIAVGFQLR